MPSSNDPRAGPPPSPRGRGDFIVRLLLTLFVIALGAALLKLADLLLLGFAAILVAILLRAIAVPLARLTGLAASWSLAVTVIALSAAMTGLVIVFGAQMYAQVQTLLGHLPGAWHGVEARLQGYGIPPKALDWAVQRIAEGGNVGLVAQLAGGAISAGGSLLLALVGGIYLAAQPDLYRRGALLLLPPKQAARVDTAFDAMRGDLRHWLVGQIATMAVVGTLTGLGAFAIGIPSAAALGLVAALLEFVPYVGPIATAVPALLLAFSLGETAAVLTLLLLVAVQQIEGYLLTPLIQRRAVSLPPALTLFAVFAMGILLGPLGVLLAAPLTVCACVLVRTLYLPAIGRDI